MERKRHYSSKVMVVKHKPQLTGHSSKRLLYKKNTVPKTRNWFNKPIKASKHQATPRKKKHKEITQEVEVNLWCRRLEGVTEKSGVSIVLFLSDRKGSKRLVQRKCWNRRTEKGGFVSKFVELASLPFCQSWYFNFQTQKKLKKTKTKEE